MKWIKRILLAIALATALVAAGGVALFLYTLHFITTAPVADPAVPLLSWQSPVQESTPNTSALAPWEQVARQDQQSPISIRTFRNPQQRFGPWTRWWWPGNLVEPAELEREMTLFAEIGLAGVEIQPFAISVTANDKQSSAWQENGWDSPAFYQNIRFTLDTAKTLGLEVDLNNGSGWPTGGPHVAHADGMRQLLHSELLVSGPMDLNAVLPKPQMPVAAFIAGAVGMAGDTPMQTFLEESQRLVAVVASKVTEDNRTWAPWDFHDTVFLDAESTRVLAINENSNKLHWNVPDGTWAITALWEMPGGELVSGGFAHPQPGYVVDHLDAHRMRANQNYLFRSETKLAQYYGNPLRAIFNDSLEFRQERHWARGHLEEFEKRMGYDPRPWLAALIEPGKDQMPFHALNVSTRPAYDLGAGGTRFLEDWDKVVSDLFRERYFHTLMHWTKARQLAHRLQAYGGPMDVIAGAGESNIPEAEQLYAGGSEMFLKAVSAGAQIAHKPIVSAESFVFMGKAFMTTPLKIKALADKAFAAGINQIVYHGTSYQISDHAERGYPKKDGWYPWQLGLISTDFSENWNYWEHAEKLNTYIARSQYLLRKGAAEADVLLLYPGLGFPQGYGNPEEPFDQGQFEGEQAPATGTTDPAAPAEPAMERGTARMQALWVAMRALEKQGLTWSWVNEETLREATFEDGVLRAKGLRARALHIQGLNAIAPDVAENIAVLSSNGLPVFLPGEAPKRQHGLAGHAEGDARVRAAWHRIVADKPYPLPIVSFTHSDVKTLRRRLPDGDILQFFSNPTGKPIEVSIRTPQHFRQSIALNAWDGSAKALLPDAVGRTTLELPAYGSTFLWLTHNAKLLASPVQLLEATAVELENWTLAVNASNYFANENVMGDWLNVTALRDNGGPGVYRTTFELDAKAYAALRKQKSLELELTKLYGAAKVTLNGKEAGSALVPPYRVDLTEHAKTGSNTLVVTLTPPRKNRLVSAIVNQEAGWDAPDLIGTRARVSAGLIGPVSLFIR